MYLPIKFYGKTKIIPTMIVPIAKAIVLGMDFWHLFQIIKIAVANYFFHDGRLFVEKGATLLQNEKDTLQTTFFVFH